MKSTLSLLALVLLSFNSFAGTDNNIQNCRLEKRSDKIHLLKGSESVYWSKNPIEAILKLDSYTKVGLCSAPKESCAIVKVSDTGEEAIFINKDIIIKGKGAEEGLILFQKNKTYLLSLNFLITGFSKYFLLDPRNNDP